MDFYRHAWRAGAEQYGRNRAERYGRLALLGMVLGWVAAGVLFLAVVYMAQRGPQ